MSSGLEGSATASLAGSKAAGLQIRCCQSSGSMGAPEAEFKESQAGGAAGVSGDGPADCVILALPSCTLLRSCHSPGESWPVSTHEPYLLVLSALSQCPSLSLDPLLLRDTLDHVNLLMAGTWPREPTLPRSDGIPVPQAQPSSKAAPYQYRPWSWRVTTGSVIVSQSPAELSQSPGMGLAVITPPPPLPLAVSVSLKFLKTILSQVAPESGSCDL